MDSFREKYKFASLDKYLYIDMSMAGLGGAEGQPGIFNNSKKIFYQIKK